MCGDQFEPDDPGHDHADAQHPDQVGRLLEQHYAEQRSANHADTGPDGVSGAKRQPPQREPQQSDASAIAASVPAVGQIREKP